MAAGKLRPRGFTLIELQIAIALVAVISVLLLGSLRLSTQTWNRVTEKDDVTEHRFMLNQVVRRHLNNMRFVTIRDEDLRAITAFYGDQRQLQFVAPFPSFNNDGQLYWWTLSSPWNDDLDRYQLVMDYLPYDVERQQLRVSTFGEIEVEDDVEPLRLVIADHVKLLSAQYYMRDREGSEDWLDEWGALDLTPQVISLVLAEVNADGDEFELPGIAVAPRFANQLLYPLGD